MPEQKRSLIPELSAEFRNQDVDDLRAKVTEPKPDEQVTVLASTLGVVFGQLALAEQMLAEATSRANENERHAEQTAKDLAVMAARTKTAEDKLSLVRSTIKGYQRSLAAEDRRVAVAEPYQDSLARGRGHRR